ncbi:hypothetical protein [Modicisalibacter xianhensis]|uniref:Uncharacterized protein n=1 Tax=Modicisalibacter xianhensis TaxID=442341 RepID=A0A1I2ZK74_9GAMM|nr:hypothetical protein [Halomonas xianhensis]SFH37986.1 hypothetical protein SAMN04487959_103170 [Halomonas xianhensis]
MPLQNRVNPFGNLHAVQARGTLLGNRGRLHDADKTIVRAWKTKAWVTCSLEYVDIQRTIFSPDSYSELFFLDEATAFAAGHRPCGSCRNRRYREFKVKWLAANPGLVTGENPSIAAIDRVLHAERTAQSGDKVTFKAAIETLPFGTIIEQDGATFLVGEEELLPWSFYGYSQPPALLPEDGTSVTVLTPASIVRLFQQGFRPEIHETASSASSLHTM